MNNMDKMDSMDNMDKIDNMDSMHSMDSMDTDFVHVNGEVTEKIDTSTNTIFHNNHTSNFQLCSCNDCLEDQFQHQIDLAITFGDTNYIKNAIIDYNGLISDSYINMARDLMFQLVGEKMGELIVNTN